MRAKHNVALTVELGLYLLIACLVEYKLKVDSFKSSDEIIENDNGSYRGFGY